MGQCGDRRLALWRPRRDGRALDREPPAGEVDVVQLVPVDEPAGGDVADLGVVLPAVPQPAQHLHVVGGLVEQVRQHAGGVGLGRVGQPELAEFTPAEVAELGVLRGDPHADAGPAGADVVECGDRLGQVEGLGVGDHGRGHQADVRGDWRDPRRDQHGVQPALHAVGRTGRATRFHCGRTGDRVGLQRQGVLDGDEVQCAGLGFPHQVGPVPRGEQLRGAGVRLAPGGRVPAGPVQGHGEMRSSSLCHTGFPSLRPWPNCAPLDGDRAGLATCWELRGFFCRGGNNRGTRWRRRATGWEFGGRHRNRGTGVPSGARAAGGRAPR